MHSIMILFFLKEFSSTAEFFSLFSSDFGVRAELSQRSDFCIIDALLQIHLPEHFSFSSTAF